MTSSQEKGKGMTEATNGEEGARDLVNGADMRTAGDTGTRENDTFEDKRAQMTGHERIGT